MLLKTIAQLVITFLCSALVFGINRIEAVSPDNDESKIASEFPVQGIIFSFIQIFKKFLCQCNTTCIVLSFFKIINVFLTQMLNAHTSMMVIQVYLATL